MGLNGAINVVPMLCLLGWAAATDLRSRRIGNELTFPLILTGLAQAWMPVHTTSPLGAWAGMGVGFGLTFVLFALRALGGGDVKLMAGVGAWMGPWNVLAVFMIAAIVGMLIVLAHALASGRLAALLRNSTMLAINLVHVGNVGLEHVSQTGQSTTVVEKPLPYAVPVLVAVVVVITAGIRMGAGL